MGTFAGSYVLDNDAPTARRILGCLSLMLDEFSIARLGQAGVPVGGRCLELGAGNGSVACWLAERVGPYGQVLATDVKTHHIRHHPGVSMLCHDLAAGDCRLARSTWCMPGCCWRICRPGWTFWPGWSTCYARAARW